MNTRVLDTYHVIIASTLNRHNAKDRLQEYSMKFEGWPHSSLAVSRTTIYALTLCIHTPGPAAHNQ